jgi:hypothetical protein
MLHRDSTVGTLKGRHAKNNRAFGAWTGREAYPTKTSMLVVISSRGIKVLQ